MANTEQRQTDESVTEFDAVVVGAGFGGMYMLHFLRELGVTARVYEVGGLGNYRERCIQVANGGYEGFMLSS